MLHAYAVHQGSRTVAGPESTFSPRAVTTQVKEQQALELRLGGYTYDAIAAQVGYVSRSSAYRAVGRAFQRIRAQADETAETLRALEDARYDRMLRAIDAKVQQGDLGAIDRALRISKARRELWGLDAPVQIQAEVSPALQALYHQWQQLRDVPPPSRHALRSAEADEDPIDAETLPLERVRLPGQPSKAQIFAMLDRVNGRFAGGWGTEGDVNDDALAALPATGGTRANQLINAPRVPGRGGALRELIMGMGQTYLKNPSISHDQGKTASESMVSWQRGMRLCLH